MKYKYFLKKLSATSESQILKFEDQLPCAKFTHLESKEHFFSFLAGIFSHEPVERNEIPVSLSPLNSPRKELTKKIEKEIPIYF